MWVPIVKLEDLERNALVLEGGAGKDPGWLSQPSI